MLKSIGPGRDKTYVGYTIDIKSRLNKHNNNKGARSTKGHKWILIIKKDLKLKMKLCHLNINLKKTENIEK